MNIDLLVENGKVFINGDTVDANLAIKDGTIVSISKTTNGLVADEKVNADNLLVLPGVIDPHCHFRDPGQAGEDFASGTMAAAAGGVTTALDMPGTNPNVANRKVFEDKAVMAEKKAYVDFGLFGGVEPGKAEKVHELAAAGAIGFKFFTGIYPPPHPYPPLERAGDIYEALKEIAKTGLTACVHCESAELMDYFGGKLMKEGRKDPLAHAESRPNLAEIDSVARCINFAADVGAKLYVVHLSTKGGMDLIAAAKRNGREVLAEVCPHHLLLDASDLERLGPMAKMNPPLRSKEDVSALWDALARGLVDVVGSDHGPTPPGSKEAAVREKDIWAAKPGVNGVETRVPLMLTQVNGGRLSLQQFVEVMVENPAKIFGMFPRKGALSIGSDADITIVDMKREETIDQEKLHSQTKLTPFHGAKVKGIPIHTIVRGKCVMRDRQVVGHTGHGRLVKPLLHRR